MRKSLRIAEAVLRVAVAVKASVACGLRERISLGRYRYEGRKVCPHSVMQCASSIATREIFCNFNRIRISGLARVSGDV